MNCLGTLTLTAVTVSPISPDASRQSTGSRESRNRCWNRAGIYIFLHELHFYIVLSNIQEIGRFRSHFYSSSHPLPTRTIVSFIIYNLHL